MLLFMGFEKNIFDFIEYSDVLLHPSVSESSSLILKEFGFRKRPVIVCRDVVTLTRSLSMENRDCFFLPMNLLIPRPNSGDPWD